MALHAFHREHSLARKLSFTNPLLWHRLSGYKIPKWGFQGTTDGNVLEIGTTIFNISESHDISVYEEISIIQDQILLETAFHLPGALMACLYRAADNSLTLQLYSIQNKCVLIAINFEDDTSRNPREVGSSSTRAFIVFDSAVIPTWLVVLVAQPDEFVDDAGVDELTGYSTSAWAGPLQAWVFDLPSLQQKKNFRIPGAGWLSDTMVQAYFAVNLGKLVCLEQRRVHNWCRVWVIDIENGRWMCQLYPKYLYLAFVREKEMIVAIVEEGWVQCKSLQQMESDMYELGNGERYFDGNTNALWVVDGWKVLTYLPPSFLPSTESGFAVHDKGELAYIGEFGKRLIQISFKW